MIQVLPATGNFASNFGANIGRGLADQVPKEIERGRLAHGLEQLGNAQGLTPFQQYTRAASIPGITPQMLQTLPDILRTDAVRDYYTNKLRLGNSKVSSESNAVSSALDQNQPNEKQNETFPKKTGVSSEFIAPTVSPEEYEEKVGEIQSQNPYLLPEQSLAIADKHFNMRNQNVQIERNNQEYLNDKYNEALGLFQSDLGLKLHLPKDEQGQYLSADKDGNPVVEGELVKSMQNGMANDIATGALTPRKAADKWTTNYLDLVKQNDKISEIKSNNIPHLEKLKGLKTIQKDYANKGAAEYFTNKIRIDFGFSTSTASLIGYPRSDAVKKYIHPIKKDHSILLANRLDKKPGSGSRKIASDIGKLMESDDSPVAIAASIKEHDPSFSENQFFDQLALEEDNLSLNARQRRDIANRGSQLLPNWTDIWYFIGNKENPFYD